MRHLFSHLLLLAVAAHAFAGIEPPRASTETINLGLRGVYFVPNHGQWSDSDVLYGLRSRGLNVAFRESSLTMHLARQVGNEASASRGKGSAPPRIDDVRDDSSTSDAHEIRGDEASAPAWEQLTLTVTFPGSNPAQPIGAQPQSAKFNYFVGGEGRGVATDVPSFGAVIYENLYDGIDLYVMGSDDDGVLKYEFHVAPGADYGQIRIHYDGIDSLCIDDSGNLHIATNLGTLRDNAPLAWQERRGASRDALTLPARFQTLDRRTFAITLDTPPDQSLPLVIDPEIEWMYYLGGSADDHGKGIAVDSTGNALMAGETSSADFGGRNNELHGYQDAFVSKADPDGQLQWMTYLGGSSFDGGGGIAVDSADNALITGHTKSWDFEGRNNEYHGGHNDGWVAKVNWDGQLQWMTYLGGSDIDVGFGISVDAAGNALVSGETDSIDFEGRNNSLHLGEFHTSDAFVAKVGPEGQMQWMTYLGGDEHDKGPGIAVDGAGNAVVTGTTYSSNFEGHNNWYHNYGLDNEGDAFLAKVDPAGQLQWSTFLGGRDIDRGQGVAVDSNGNARVTGSTFSTDFEGGINAPHGASSDIFLVNVDSGGRLQWMCFLGGSGTDSGYGIAVDSDDDAIVTGGTASVDFEGRDNALHGGGDACVVKVDSNGQLQWMTYLGGSDDEHGESIALGAPGNAIVSGGTRSVDFEGRINELHGVFWMDAFVIKLNLDDRPQLSISASCPSGGPIQVSWQDASPNGQIAILFARTTGSLIIPSNRPCPGTTLGLSSEQIQIAFQGSAGPDGSRTLNANAGPNACGGYLQLLDLTTCATSNVVRIE